MLNKLIACSLIFATTTVCADTNWTNFQGDAAHTGYIAIKTNPQKIEKIWEQTYNLEVPDDKRLPVFMYMYEGMVIAGETAYLTIEEDFPIHGKPGYGYRSSSLIAIDINSGNIKWQQMLGDYHEVMPPVYENGRVFVIDYDRVSETTQLIAYLADSGKEDYRTSMSGVGSIYGVVAANGSIFNKSKNFESIDSRTGKLNWSTSYDHDASSAFGLATVSDQYIIRHFSSYLDVADAKSGQPLFKISAEQAWYDDVIVRFPVYDAARNTVYQGLRIGGSNWHPGIQAYDLNKRQIKWSVISDFSQLVLAGNDIYAMAGVKDTDKTHTALQARDAETGAVKWQWITDKFMPAMHKRLIVTDDVVFIPFDKSIVAISRQSHQKVWETNNAGIPYVANNKLIIVGYGDKGVKLTAYALS